MADLLPGGGIPPSSYVGNLNADYKSAAERTEANQDALAVELWSGTVNSAYEVAKGFADMLPVKTFTGHISDQEAYTNKLDANYAGPGTLRTSNDNYRKTDRTITPDMAAESVEFVSPYDSLISQVDDLAEIGREQGRVLRELRETKAIKALFHGANNNAEFNGTDNEAVYTDVAGNDYGLAATRKQTLTDITSKALLLGSAGTEFRAAIADAVMALMEMGVDIRSMGMRPRCYVAPDIIQWFRRSDEGKTLIDRDINREDTLSYNNVWDSDVAIDGCTLTYLQYANKAALTNVTYGWKADGLNGFERDAANKYVSDNSKIVGVVGIPQMAIRGAQVQGLITDSFFSQLHRAQVMYTSLDIAYKTMRNELLFPIALDT